MWQFLVAGASLLSASGSIRAGKAEAAAQNFNAQISERNAKVADQQAEVTRMRTELDIQDFRRDFRDFQGFQAQLYRHNGFVATSGTPLQVLLESAEEADRQIADMRYNGSVESMKLLEQAAQDRMQADLNRMYGSEARTASYYQAGSSLLSGGSTIAKG